MEKFYEKHQGYYGTGDELLLLLIKKYFNIHVINFEDVCRFHLTRVKNIMDLREGIQPLNLKIKNIWSLLYELINKEITLNEWILFENYLESINENHFYIE